MCCDRWPSTPGAAGCCFPTAVICSGPCSTGSRSDRPTGKPCCVSTRACSTPCSRKRPRSSGSVCPPPAPATCPRCSTDCWPETPRWPRTSAPGWNACGPGSRTGVPNSPPWASRTRSTTPTCTTASRSGPHRAGSPSSTGATPPSPTRSAACASPSSGPATATGRRCCPGCSTPIWSRGRVTAARRRNCGARRNSPGG